MDVEELTQTIVNEYIKKIVVFAPDKSSGKRQQKVKIYFNFVDDVEIPVISETIITETTYGRRKRACCRKQFLRHALFANKSREKRQHSVKIGNIASKSKHPKPKEV